MGLGWGHLIRYKYDSDQGGTWVVPVFSILVTKHIMCLRAQGELGSHGHMLMPASRMLWKAGHHPTISPDGSFAVKWGLLYYILGRGRGSPPVKVLSKLLGKG